MIVCKLGPVGFLGIVTANLDISRIVALHSGIYGLQDGKDSETVSLHGGTYRTYPGSPGGVRTPDGKDSGIVTLHGGTHGTCPICLDGSWDSRMGETVGLWLSTVGHTRPVRDVPTGPRTLGLHGHTDMSWKSGGSRGPPVAAIFGPGSLIVALSVLLGLEPVSATGDLLWP